MEATNANEHVTRHSPQPVSRHPRKWETHDPTERLRALQQSASREHRALRHAALFISVAAMIVGNVLVPLIFIPLMLALKGWFLYALITLTGFGMGLLFEILTRSIASLRQHHHILLGMLVPLCAIVGVLFIADFANDIASGFGIGSTHSPQLVAAAYALAFLAPYAHYRFVLRKRHYLG